MKKLDNIKKSNKFNILIFSIKIVISFIFISIFLYIVGPFYSKALIPIFSKEIKLLHPEYVINTIKYEKKFGTNELLLDVSIHRRHFTVNGDFGSVRNVSFSIYSSTIYSHPIIIFTLMLSWPGLGIKKRLIALFISGLFAILITLIDIPIYLIYLAENDLVINTIFGKIRSFWGFFLETGGRQFLSLLAFFITISFFYLKIPSFTFENIKRNDPCPCKSGKKYKNCCGINKV